ncbi:vesicle transport v-SNARE 12-like [Olea europaea subsp. europaea]|uniref:Vesicle transport v-SNARE 12-like n=1 Tax=Olea europaea subsp. europaea TaxID=158383 RepID=A0A8S0T5W4_OLEEU|nr:vesicle transport v-SNARE 12-like [Olea europaea subsp. europaea]
MGVVAFHCAAFAQGLGGIFGVCLMVVALHCAALAQCGMGVFGVGLMIVVAVESVAVVGQLEVVLTLLVAASTNQREKLTMSIERLNQSTNRIKESRHAAVETEVLEVSILEDQQ